MFLNNLTPSQAYNTYLLNSEKDCEDNLNVHLRKVNISKCPRQRDFNSFILNTFKKILEGKIAQKCFVILKSNNIMDTHKEAKTAYQVYNKDGRAALILGIINR